MTEQRTFPPGTEVIVNDPDRQHECRVVYRIDSGDLYRLESPTHGDMIVRHVRDLQAKGDSNRA